MHTYNWVVRRRRTPPAMPILDDQDMGKVKLLL